MTSKALLLTLGHFLWCVWSKSIDNCELNSLSGDDGAAATQRDHAPARHGLEDCAWRARAGPCVPVRALAALPCGLLSLCILSSSKALCPHSSSRSSLPLSRPSSRLSVPSQDTLWAGLCSGRQDDVEGRLGATLHTAIPLLLATPRILDTSDRKLLNCKDKPKAPDCCEKYRD